MHTHSLWTLQQAQFLVSSSPRLSREKSSFSCSSYMHGHVFVSTGMAKFGGLAKLHLQERNGEVIKVEYHMFPKNTFCSGATFVAKCGSVEEDDGWIITFVHDEDMDSSQVVNGSCSCFLSYIFDKAFDAVSNCSLLVLKVLTCVLFKIHMLMCKYRGSTLSYSVVSPSSTLRGRVFALGRKTRHVYEYDHDCVGHAYILVN